MRLRPTITLVLTAAVVLSACSVERAGGNGSRRGDDPSADEPATTTTTIPAAYRPVVDARREAHHQYELARDKPTNPENPVVRDYFTGTELLQVIRWQVFSNGIGTRYTENSQHRFEIESVTFSDTDPNVAWLETCWVDDGENYYLRNGQTADVVTSIFEIPPVRTIHRTEEMRNENGKWKVARAFQNSYQEGVTGCGADDQYGDKPYAESPASPDLTKTITDSRTAAEQAYVAYLTSQVPTGFPETWTGFQRDLYFANGAFGSGEHKRPDDNYCPADVTLIATSATSNEYRQFYLQDDSLNPWKTDPYYGYPHGKLNQSPCYKDYQLGQNAWTFLVRADGRTFDPSTTSTIVVQSVQLQTVENPHVAYLTTCRTYNLAPTGQGEFKDTQGSVISTEVMHLEDGKWKVSNRWGYTRADTCA